MISIPLSTDDQRPPQQCHICPTSQIYSHQSNACKAAAPQWEAAHKVAGRDSWGGLGRVHWHSQQVLVHRIAHVGAAAAACACMITWPAGLLLLA
jgi:hypothetical protein